MFSESIDRHEQLLFATLPKFFNFFVINLLDTSNINQNSSPARHLFVTSLNEPKNRYYIKLHFFLPQVKWKNAKRNSFYTWSNLYVVGIVLMHKSIVLWRLHTLKFFKEKSLLFESNTQANFRTVHMFLCRVAIKVKYKYYQSVNHFFLLFSLFHF